MDPKPRSQRGSLFPKKLVTNYFAPCMGMAFPHWKVFIPLSHPLSLGWQDCSDRQNMMVMTPCQFRAKSWEGLAASASLLLRASCRVRVRTWRLPCCKKLLYRRMLRLNQVKQFSRGEPGTGGTGIQAQVGLWSAESFHYTKLLMFWKGCVILKPLLTYWPPGIWEKENVLCGRCRSLGSYRSWFNCAPSLIS